MESVKGLVSIIIPVYNGGKYLAACLDSLSAQTYANIEILIIDDGSTDDSFAICEKYAAVNERIRLISKSNSGVSDTRNTGLDNAKGEFIVFVDCDDKIEKDYVSHLVSLMSDNIDFGVTGWTKEKENGEFVERCVTIDSEFSSEGCLMNLVTLNAVQGYPFAKIFRNKIITENNIRFDKEITIFEDLLFCCEYVNHCRKGKINTNYNDSHYIIHENSARNKTIHSKTFDAKWLTEIKALEKILEAVSSYKKSAKKVRARIALSSSFYINRMFDCGYEDKALQDELRRNVKKNLGQALFSSEGDFKWKMQALLCAISPKFEYKLKRKT